MEFIRHKGDLQCSNPRCNEVEDQRVIYYCFNEGKQVYWFVCGKCNEWTKLTFGYEEIGPLALALWKRNAKIQNFDLKQYGTNW
jgi:Fe2+ or Zn2+ uptake regulation protein